MHSGGMLFVQPEHLLSFELMGIERMLSNQLELGNILTDTQRWLDCNSRDILDESDEILSVRFELIYTTALQRASEFSPDRWTIDLGAREPHCKFSPSGFRSRLGATT